MSIITDTLLGAVAQKGLTHYKEEYRTPDRLDASLGCAIASYCDWDFEKILEIFLPCLEDANWHSLYKVIEEHARKQGILKP